MTREIDFTAPNCKDTLASGLNFYSQNFGFPDSKTWALHWIKQNLPDEYDRLKAAKDTQFSNRGFVCRMIARGLEVSQAQLESLAAFFKAIQTDPKPVEVDPSPSIQSTRKKAAPNIIIHQLEDIVDAILSDNDPTEVSIPTDVKQLEVARAWMEKEILEASEQISKHQAILMKLEDAYARCGGMVSGLKKVSTKVIKPVPPSKTPAAQAIKTMTYQKEDKDLGIVSLSPGKIVGARKVFAYQTNYKYGMLFVAKGSEGLSVSNSSIRGFDEEQSFMKTIRKPKEFFSSANIFLELGLQTSKRTKITSHINDKTILVAIE